MKLPAPTMRMRRETMKAAAQEKAIPLWAERRSRFDAIAPPKKRLKPTAVVLTRLMTRSAGSAPSSLLGGMFGTKPQATPSIESRFILATTTKKRPTMPHMTMPRRTPSNSVLSSQRRAITTVAYAIQVPTRRPIAAPPWRSSVPGRASTASNPPANVFNS